MKENYEKTGIIIKTIIIISAVLITTIIIILTYNYLNKNSLIKKKLKKQNYTELNNIYVKDIKENDRNITYTYNFNNNKFSKYISNKSSKERETINLTYKNNKIKIDYTYQDTSSCRIIQQATYNEKNYKCDILTKKGNCKSKCDIILKEAKKFFKEQKKLTK